MVNPYKNLHNTKFKLLIEDLIIFFIRALKMCIEYSVCLVVIKKAEDVVLQFTHINLRGCTTMVFSMTQTNFFNIIKNNINDIKLMYTKKKTNVECIKI